MQAVADQSRYLNDVILSPAFFSGAKDLARSVSNSKTAENLESQSTAEKTAKRSLTNKAEKANPVHYQGQVAQFLQ